MRFEFQCKTSYPPVLIDKQTKQQCVIVSQTEVFLTNMLIELDERIVVLEDQINSINKRLIKKLDQN